MEYGMWCIKTVHYVYGELLHADERSAKVRHALKRAVNCSLQQVAPHVLGMATTSAYSAFSFSTASLVLSKKALMST